MQQNNQGTDLYFQDGRRVSKGRHSGKGDEGETSILSRKPRTTSYVEREDGTTLYIAPWNRRAVGTFFQLTNSGIVQTLFRITSDVTVIPNSREQGFGLGVHADLPLMPFELNQSLRLTLAWLQLRLLPKGILATDYTSSQNEKTASLASLGGVYRWGAFDLTDEGGTVWYGLGALFNYVFYSNTKAVNSTEVNYVTGSFGANAIVSIGIDYPVSGESDVGFEMDYHPPLGYSGRILYRFSY